MRTIGATGTSALLGIATLLIGACGGDGGGSGAGRLADPARREVPSDRLAVVGSVIDEPDAEDTVLVAIRRDGAMACGSQVGGLPELHAHLVERTRDPRRREPDGSSRLSVVLRVDRDAP